MLIRFVLLISCFIGPITAWEVSCRDTAIELEEVFEGELVEEEKIFIAAFLEAYKDITEEDLGVKDKATFLKQAFEDVREDLKNHDLDLIVAKIDGKVVGFVGFKKSENQIYIAQLAVDPAFWRRGIGKELVFSSLLLYPELRELVVIARRINEVARRFYIQLGFQESSYMYPGYDPKKYTGYQWSAHSVPK